jgi:acetyl-CoA carboxylase, biotin carboxylase subunit
MFGQSVILSFATVFYERAARLVRPHAILAQYRPWRGLIRPGGAFFSLAKMVPMSLSRPISKILIANRGEIAVRIIRTCRDLGIATVAVFSDADRTAPHVRMADEARNIGPAASADSYLSIPKILDAARETGSDAIHPGYGFLSENAAFAEACEEAGVIFIGPPANAIRALGDKTSARALMAKAGVPMAPGTKDAISDPDEARRIAGEIGYPILIKAAAGGGGKGMRIVESERDLLRSLDMARGEAQSAFGDGRIFIEKYIQRPRHIEFQILADRFGNCVHFFERECSIQRRHQKVIEEAPSAVLTPGIRQEMGQAAVMAAQACGYVGTGTVEFLVDADLNFYFMEVNARLQVEHPVTEQITGFDLVAEQIRIAEGNALGFGQDDIRMQGHAIECRVYAEDPTNNFLPDPGPLHRHRPPLGPGVRVDAGVEENGRVEIHYDPMISKLVTWGSDRDEAIRRMVRALSEYEISGVRTTIPFCSFVMQHNAFREGDFSTHFVSEHFRPEYLREGPADIEEAAAVAAALISAAHSSNGVAAGGVLSERSKWTRRRWPAR